MTTKPQPVPFGHLALPLCRVDGDPARTRDHHAFGHLDRFGRELGAAIYTWAETFRPVGPDEDPWGRRVEPGTYFTFRPQATRDGASYGPIQRDVRYATEADRDAAIRLYLDGARKRAAKAGTPKPQAEPAPDLAPELAT